jgi:hypothetical protein
VVTYTGSPKYRQPEILTGRPIRICVMAGRASTRVRVGPAIHVFDYTKESRGRTGKVRA